MECLENRATVGIGEDVPFIKEVGVPRHQLWEASSIACFMDVRRQQGFHGGVSSVELQHASEHSTVRRHAFHGPDEH